MTATKPKPKADDAPPPAPPGVKAAPPDGPVRGTPVAGMKEPEFGTAKPADPVGELPRECNPLERAVAGVRRFKFRGESGTGLGLMTVKYVLAADATAAELHYRELVKAADADRVVCTELAD